MLQHKLLSLANRCVRLFRHVFGLIPGSDVLNPRPTSLLRRMTIPGRTPRIRLFNSNLANNRRGISAHFYDR